jgi:hypothetical protein
MSEDKSEDEQIITVAGVTSLSEHSTILLDIGGNTYKLKPLSAMDYYEYLEKRKESEQQARAEAISTCLIEPIKTAIETMQLPIGTFTLLYKHLINASFLEPPPSNKLEE